MNPSDGYDSKNEFGISQLLTNWENRLNIAQAGHYMQAEKYSCINNFTGVTLALITAILGASLLAETSSSFPAFRYVPLVLSFISAMLAGYQMFARPAEKAELHRQKAAKYGALKRKVESVMSSEPTDEKKRIFLNGLVIEWDYVASDTPLTPLKIREKANEYVQQERKNHSSGTTKKTLWSRVCDCFKKLFFWLC